MDDGGYQIDFYSSYVKAWIGYCVVYASLVEGNSLYINIANFIILVISRFVKYRNS